MDMKLSARNQIKGTIVAIDEGAVNAIVKIKIGTGEIISATISMNAVKDLELTVGKTAYAVIKATSVMVGVDD
jgi:molybdopterin-binding protein